MWGISEILLLLNVLLSHRELGFEVFDTVILEELWLCFIIWASRERQTAGGVFSFITSPTLLHSSGQERPPQPSHTKLLLRPLGHTESPAFSVAEVAIAT